MTLAFLLVEKHDLNLLYKYSKNEKRTLTADGVWSVLTHSAEVGGEPTPLGLPRAALLRTPGWARSHSLHGGTQFLARASAH